MPTAEYKRCPRCKDTLSLTKFFWDHGRNRPQTYCKVCANAKRREWHQVNRHRKHEWHIAGAYGLSPDGYAALHDSHLGGCALCGADGRHAHKSRLAVDHDSETGQIRGLLCDTCNRGIGLLGHDLDRLRAAIDYLEAAQ